MRKIIAIPHQLPAKIWYVTDEQIEAFNKGDNENDVGLHDLHSFVDFADAKKYKGHQESKVSELADSNCFNY